MEICIIAINYTTDKQQVHVFLDNLVRILVDKGVKCSIIAPQSSYSYYRRKDKRRPFEYERTTEKGNKYKIFSPLYTVYPTAKIGKMFLSDKSRYSFYRAIEKTYKKQNLNADIIYSHFLQAGISGVMLAKKLGIPSYIANGEADTVESVKHLSPNLIRKTLEDVTGIISVSTKCKEEIEELCGHDDEIVKKITVIPNAANTKVFHKLDKKRCRKELGFPEDKFIVSFVGSFIERKGIQKVAKAVDELDEIYAVFIGTGPDNPCCKNILFKGRVNNGEMVKYLNSTDVFVLPTTAEGCSNAIVEAMACGLPIVSSNRSFNLDILDKSCAILIDPNNQREITEAIKSLKENQEMRNKLSEGSNKKSKTLSLESRANKILRLITQ